MPKSTKEPTLGSRIEGAFSAGVALTEGEVMERTGLGRDAVHNHLHTIAALYNAATCTREHDGDWMWRLTPASDTRTKRCLERVPEGPGHRTGQGGHRKLRRLSRLLREANEIADALRRKKEQK